MKGLLSLYDSTIGKKMVVAVTGLLMVGFVVSHMAGNLKMFAGCDASGICKMDEYAVFLKEIGKDVLGKENFLWLARFGLLGALFLHVITIIQLRARNAKAAGTAYKAGNKQAGSFSGAYMFVGGLIILAFVIFHILHFTTGDLLEGFVYGDVYANVVKGFSVPWVAGFYIVAMAALALHLHHGIWSMCQTLGIDNPDRNGMLRCASAGIAAIVFLGFVSVPISVMAGILSAP